MIKVHTASRYPTACMDKVSAILLFKKLLLDTGMLCKIHKFSPSKEMDDAAGQLIESIAAITNGAYCPKNEAVSSIPAYLPIR